jgi:anti-sigma B factor antagonist
VMVRMRVANGPPLLRHSHDPRLTTPRIRCRFQQGLAKGGPIVELALDVSKTGSLSVVDVKGEIDVYTAPKLREKLIELVSEGSYNVVVNLEGVDFLDSTGLGVLVGALKRVKAHDGTLNLVCTQEKILKIFKITGLTKVFPIYDSVDSAVASGDKDQ